MHPKPLALLKNQFIASLMDSMQDEKITEMQCATLLTFVHSCDDMSFLALIVAGSMTFEFVEMVTTA